MQVNFFDIVLSGSKLPTKWLRFYIKIRFPIGIVISLIMFINSITVTDFSIYDTSSLLFVIFFFALDFFNISLLVWTYMEMKKLTPRGYVLNLVYIYFFEIYYAVIYGLPYMFTSQFWSYFLIGAIPGLVWLIPNLIYFRKRKDLFYRGASVTQDSRVENADNEVAADKETITSNNVINQNDVFSTIEKLNELKEKGILTEQEFTEKKGELLQKI